MQTRTNFDTPALLAQVPLFNSLGDDELARLARGTRELTAARGEILFHKGDAPSGFYLILDGQVKLAFAQLTPIQATPTTLVIDRDGRVAARIIGQLATASILSTLVADTLAEDAP